MSTTLTTSPATFPDVVVPTPGDAADASNSYGTIVYSAQLLANRDDFLSSSLDSTADRVDRLERGTKRTFPLIAQAHYHSTYGLTWALDATNFGVYQLVTASTNTPCRFPLSLPQGAVLANLYIRCAGNSGLSALPSGKPNWTLYRTPVTSGTPANIGTPNVLDPSVTLGEYVASHVVTMSVPTTIDNEAYRYDLVGFGESGPDSTPGFRVQQVFGTWTSPTGSL